MLLLCVSGAATPVFGGWEEVRTGPFIVLTDAGEGPARQAANHLEQFRYALGQAFGRVELTTMWPITVVVEKNLSGEPFLAFGRDGWTGNWPAKSVPPAAWFRRLARVFLEENLQGRMPPGYEAALADAVSTVSVEGVRITFGAPPPEDARSLQWAIIHMLTTNPDTAGRVRALVTNLANGADEGASFRNSFQKNKPEIEAEAKAYLATGKFESISYSGRPFDERRLPVREALPSRIRALQGDLLLAQGRFKESAEAYKAGLKLRAGPGLHEGYGLAMLGLGDQSAAKTALISAVADKDDERPRALVELARLETDAAMARTLVERAAQANPKWAEPYVVGASQEAGPVRKAALLKKAVELDPRRVELWQNLAQAQMDAKQFDEATKSWLAAERSAADESERQRIIEARRAADALRIEAAAEARRREAAEKAADLERLRLENEARIRAAEAKANKQTGEYEPTRKIEQWWEGPPTESALGTLERVDCTRGRATLRLRTGEGQSVAFAVPDVSKLSVIGSTQATLACGAQRPPRQVKVDYLPGKTKAAPGEAVTIEFR